MTRFIYKYWLKITGIVVGALAGFAYYFFIGCSTGTCPIKSNPYAMTVYGGIMGYLLFDMIKLKPKNNDNNKEIL